MSFGIMMQDSDVKNIDVLTLLPQRPPFVMIDRLTHYDEVVTTTNFTVREDNIFLDDMKLAPAGIIENMAQACAARMGCINRLHGESVKIGFIGDIRNCDILRQPRCHEILTTHVHIVEDVFNMTLAEVSTHVGDEMIASARVKIALIDQEPAD